MGISDFNPLEDVRNSWKVGVEETKGNFLKRCIHLLSLLKALSSFKLIFESLS